MPAWDADISRNMTPASRRKQYTRNIAQQGVEVADADTNDNTQLMYEKLRTFIESLGGAAFFFSDAFKVVGDGSNNDVRIDPGSGFIRGHEAYQGLAARYVNLGAAQEDVNLHSVSTGLTATVLTDTAMNWAVNELVGRELFPNLTDGTSFTVLSNTATTITVAGDMTVNASVGDSYYLAMSTPSGGGRTDTLWMNLYLDEISADEDADLFHNLGSGIELDRRVKVRTIMMVEQGTSAYVDYVDGDGLQHYLVKLATITRFDGQAAINAPDVSDDRTTTTSAGGTVVVTSNDTTSGSLSAKLVAGAGITLTVLNPGGSETFEISAPGSTTDEAVKVTGADTTPGVLNDKVEVVSPLVKSTLNPGADEDLEFAISSPGNPNLFLSGTNPPTWQTPAGTGGGGGSGGTATPLAGKTVQAQPDGAKSPYFQVFNNPSSQGIVVDFDVPVAGDVITPPVGATHAILNVRVDVNAVSPSVEQGGVALYAGPYTATPASLVANSREVTFVSINEALEGNVTNTGQKIVELNDPLDPAGDLSLYMNITGTLASFDVVVLVSIEGFLTTDTGAAPDPVVFSADQTGVQGINPNPTFALATAPQLVFNQEDIDTVQAFDASTGVFTAPMDGSYFFHAFVGLDDLLPIPKNFRVHLARDPGGAREKQYYALMANANGESDPTQSISGIFDLLEGETVVVRVSHDAGAALNTQGGSRFEGFLIQTSGVVPLAGKTFLPANDGAKHGGTWGGTTVSGNVDFDVPANGGVTITPPQGATHARVRISQRVQAPNAVSALFETYVAAYDATPANIDVIDNEVGTGALDSATGATTASVETTVMVDLHDPALAEDLTWHLLLTSGSLGAGHAITTKLVVEGFYIDENVAAGQIFDLVGKTVVPQPELEKLVLNKAVALAATNTEHIDFDTPGGGGAVAVTPPDKATHAIVSVAAYIAGVTGGTGAVHFYGSAYTAAPAADINQKIGVFSGDPTTEQAPNMEAFKVIPLNDPVDPAGDLTIHTVRTASMTGSLLLEVRVEAWLIDERGANVAGEALTGLTFVPDRRQITTGLETPSSADRQGSFTIPSPPGGATHAKLAAVMSCDGTGTGFDAALHLSEASLAGPSANPEDRVCAAQVSTQNPDHHDDSGGTTLALFNLSDVGYFLGETAGSIGTGTMQAEIFLLGWYIQEEADAGPNIARGPLDKEAGAIYNTSGLVLSYTWPINAKQLEVYVKHGIPSTNHHDGGGKFLIDLVNGTIDGAWVQRNGLGGSATNYNNAAIGPPVNVSTAMQISVFNTTTRNIQFNVPSLIGGGQVDLVQVQAY